MIRQSYPKSSPVRGSEPEKDVLDELHDKMEDRTRRLYHPMSSPIRRGYNRSLHRKLQAKRNLGRTDEGREKLNERCDMRDIMKQQEEAARSVQEGVDLDDLIEEEQQARQMEREEAELENELEEMLRLEEEELEAMIGKLDIRG